MRILCLDKPAPMPRWKSITLIWLPKLSMPGVCINPVRYAIFTTDRIDPALRSSLNATRWNRPKACWLTFRWQKPVC